MMKKFFSAMFVSLAVMSLTACGGTKSQPSKPLVAQEYDPSSGEWKPLTKVVQAPPHEGGAVIAKQEKQKSGDGFMKKVGDTVKKPLKWIGLGGKDDSQQPQSPTTTIPGPR